MDKLNCYDAMIFSAGKLLLPPCDLHYYFLDAFSIKNYKGGTHESIYNEIVKDDNDILKKYYGFCVQKKMVEDKTLLEKQIEEILLCQQKPIGIQMDSYYIPWNDLQFQMHRVHCFLITGISNNNYICVDKFLTENKVYIEKDFLMNNVEFLFIFDYDEKFIKKYNLHDIILYIKSYVAIEHKNHIRKLSEFANKLADLINETTKRINRDSVEQSGLIFSIANIEWSRKNFSNALKLAKENFNTSLFDNIILLIDEIYVLWGKLKSIVIKSIIVDQYIIKASQLIRTIADKENKVMELIININ